eukprot:Gb_13928 [translate_table: standard]
MPCFFKSKNNITQEAPPPPRESEAAPHHEPVPTSPYSAPSTHVIAALDNKVNQLMKFKQKFAQITEMKNNLRELHIGMTAIKQDMAKKIGYPLAIQLINQVSEITDPITDKSATRAQPSPWSWLSKHPHFRKITDRLNPDHDLPEGIKSLDDIISTAAKVTAKNNINNNNSMNSSRMHKSRIEQLYVELKSFKDKGYLEALRTADSDLHGFLCLSDLIGSQFLAGPRIMHITAHMLLRARIELGINWQTWEKLPQKWVERFPPREIISFERIAEFFKDFKESGLLTPDLRNKYFLCCTYSENASEIRQIYKARIADKKEKVPRHDNFGRPVRASSTSTLKFGLDTSKSNNSTTKERASSNPRKHTSPN